MANALEVINNDPNVKSIFINIFGGITKGEEVANGIVQALEQVDISSPIVIRLDGTNAEQGREILKSHESDRLVSKPTMVEAARTAVQMAKGEPDEHPRERRHEGDRAGPHRRPRSLLRPAQPRVRHEGRRRCEPEEGRHRRRGHPGVRVGEGSRRRDGRDRDDGDRARARGRRRRAGSRRGRRRVDRRGHRGHPDARRGELLQPRDARLPGLARARPELSGTADAGRVQHRLHPRRGRAGGRSGRHREPLRARSPTRRSTSWPRRASASPRASASAATRFPARASSTASSSSKPIPRPRP